MVTVSGCLNRLKYFCSRYELSVDIYDADNRKLFPSSNLVVKVEFMQSGYFNVAQATENGTWITGIPIKSGTVQVKATLVGTRNANGYIDELPVPLTATAVMEIFEQIDLQPKISGKHVLEKLLFFSVDLL